MTVTTCAAVSTTIGNDVRIAEWRTIHSGHVLLVVCNDRELGDLGPDLIDVVTMLSVVSTTSATLERPRERRSARLAGELSMIRDESSRPHGPQRGPPEFAGGP
jgi:hypothetical protein